MNKVILTTGIQEFIEKNYRADIMSVLLKQPVFEGVSQKELAQQLLGKKKCREKLPTWFKTPNIYYPTKVNIEQTSSEQTAQYKSKLVEGDALIDITGGFGVDSFFFSKQMKKVIHCEIDSELSKIARHNFEMLHTSNVDVLPVDGVEHVIGSDQKVDWIYADPSRRSASGDKVFRLADSEPNVVKHLEAIFDKTDNVLIKTAPLLDITMGLSELKHVAEVHIVALKNEVKELLWILRKGFQDEPKMIAVHLYDDTLEQFEFLISEERKASITFSRPKKHLYEPNAALLKAGAFKSVATNFGLEKLHEHSHLYTSDQKINFPGRTFEIKAVHDYNKKEIKKLGIQKANITTRNFPESVASIRKKFGVKDGGNTYLFFTKDLNDSLIMIDCRKTTQ